MFIALSSLNLPFLKHHKVLNSMRDALPVTKKKHYFNIRYLILIKTIFIKFISTLINYINTNYI